MKSPLSHVQFLGLIGANVSFRPFVDIELSVENEPERAVKSHESQPKFPRFSLYCPALHIMHFPFSKVNPGLQTQSTEPSFSSTKGANKSLHTHIVWSVVGF